MRQLLQPDILFPISTILLLMLLTVYAASCILKSIGLLREPIAGIEYSSAIVSACFLLGMLWLYSAIVSPLMELYKALPALKEFPVSVFLKQSGQLTAVIFFAMIVFILVSILLCQYLPGIKRPLRLVRQGNLPLSIILGLLSFGVAAAIRQIAVELMDYLAPTVINIY